MRSHPRPRHELHPVAFALLRPFLTFSYHREAWVLVAIGNRVGPVVRQRQSSAAVNGSRQPPTA